jgi:hypothetical protein
VSSAVPLWVAVLLSLIPSVVAVVAIVTAEVRDRRRLAHEKESRLRDERIAAYRKLLAATSTAHVEREGIEALAESYAEITLLAGTDELERAAAKVLTAYAETQSIADKKVEDWEPDEDHAANFAQALDKARIAREAFLKLARQELRIEQRQQEGGPGLRSLGDTPPT